MANTFTQIYLHLVFAVKNRISLVQPDWKDELYKYITGIIQNNGHKLIAINGMPNHLHISIGYKPHQLIPDLLQDIKGYSSKQALALREAYLLFFEESHSSRTDIIGEDFHTKLDKTIQMVMTPLRQHLGILDEGTIRKIYDVQHYLHKFESLEDLKKEKIEFFNETDMARQFVKADQIAFRLGLISQPLSK